MTTGANAPFVRGVHSPSVDYAALDRVTKDANAAQQIDRAVSYAFSPYTQARPDLYEFQRNGTQPRIFTQMRKDRKYMGSVKATDMSEMRVTKIDWNIVGGGKLEFEMIGTNTRNPSIAAGYCKLTNIDRPENPLIGTLGWVAVVKRLHGKDLRANQIDERILPIPILEAIATGVAYARYDDDPQIRTIYPELSLCPAIRVPPAADIRLSTKHIGEPVKALTKGIIKANPKKMLQNVGTGRNISPATETPSSVPEAQLPPWVVIRPTDANTNVNQVCTANSNLP